MKIGQALKISSVLTGRQIPSDMFDEHLVYYSASKDMWIKMVDMDIAHLVRAFAKVYDPNEYPEKSPCADCPCASEKDRIKYQEIMAMIKKANED